MKRIVVSIISTLLLSAFLTPTFMASLAHTQIAQARTIGGEEVFRISDQRHRDLEGNFFDTSLEAKLASDGVLGKLLISASSRPIGSRLLFIDPMLIEEVQDLTDGYTLTSGDEIEASAVATAWITRLESLINGDVIGVIPYGDPDVAFLAKSAPSELRIQRELSRQRLSELLSREVSQIEAPVEVAESGVKLPTFVIERFTAHRKEIRNIARYAKNPVTRSLRLANASLLNSALPKELSTALTKELSKRLERYSDSVRISKGRFTLTSKRERLPLTLINDFTNEITVKFRVSSSNTRILVDRIEPITIPAESKVPFVIPIEVLSSGQSEVIISMRTKKGIPLGQEVRLPVNLAVISPLTTWITTGSGLILLFAAIVQSVRRVKRSREGKKSV